MFYSNGDSNQAHSRDNFPRGYQHDEAQVSQSKFFADAYSNQIVPHKENNVSYENRERVHYRSQLIQAERRLFAEILLMAVMYQYYERFSHHLRHWVRPRVWLHEGERVEHRLSRQWHNWSRQNHWQDWGKEGVGLAGKLIADARHNIGQPVWAFTKFASVCQAGNLGCAATVSELLQEVGVKIPGSAGVYGVVDQLSAAGWQRIKISDKQQFRAGDVVFGVYGSHGHIGIISEANNGRVLVCDNSSSAGTLKERTIESGGSFTTNGRFAGSLYVMRPPVRSNFA